MSRVRETAPEVELRQDSAQELWKQAIPGWDGGARVVRDKGGSFSDSGLEEGLWRRTGAPHSLRKPAPTLVRLVLVLPGPPVKRQKGRVRGGSRRD